MTNFPVKYIHSAMRGAPVMNGTPGAMLAAMRAFFVTGWAPTSAVSVSVSAGVATIVFSAGQSFEAGAVVLISGAVLPELNGEARVLTGTSDRITVACTAADGVASGAISVRYAPASWWEEVYSKTGVSVFRSNDPTGSRMYCRVDDTGGQTCRVVAYESMSDVDTGTGPFPTSAQKSDGGYWFKSGNTSATAVPWRMAADSKCFLLGVASGVAAYGNTFLSAPLRGFGEGVVLSPSGDPWATFVSVAGSGADGIVGSLDSGSVSQLTSGCVFSARGIAGLGSAAVLDTQPFTGSANAASGADAYLGALPSVVDGQIKPARLFLKEQTAGSPPRAIVPGAYYIPQSGALTVLADGAILPAGGALAGRRFMVCTTGPTNGSPAGRFLLDLDGPWR